MQTDKELLKEAQLLNKSKKYEKVIELLEDKVIEIHQNSDLYAEKALAYGNLKKFEFCSLNVDKALKINPLNIQAITYEGNLHKEAKLYDKAI
jgi:tetratricopeptide (TPR) repeat protein